MTTISIQDKALTSKLCMIALTLGITPDAVATGILYAHCMSAKEKKKATATPATTTAQPTPQPETKQETQAAPPSDEEALAAMRALRAQLKQS